jgi:hypothetical protein
VTLDSDVDCTTTGSFGYGIQITADDVRLDLAGHAIRGGSFNGILGSPATGTLKRVVILNGTIEGFETGIRLPAVDSHIRQMTILARFTGIAIGSDGSGAGLTNCQANVTNCIVRNDITLNGIGFLTGIQANGDDNNIWGNTVRLPPITDPPPTGISVNGERDRVQLNHIEGCGGIYAVGYGTYLIVWGNTIMGCEGRSGYGMYLTAPPDGGNARVRLNTVTNVGTGIEVIDRTALIADNDSSGNAVSGIFLHWPTEDPPRLTTNVVLRNNADNNGQDGIGIRASGTRVQQNDADTNLSYGIDAGPDAIDGGGNTASGNGQDCSLNLSCSP